MYTFPTLLKHIRVETQLTQEELARALGVSTILISMIETGQKEASKAFILRLAERLEVHPSSIVPFLFAETDKDRRLSRLEMGLARLGEQFQAHLIKVKASKLKQYV